MEKNDERDTETWRDRKADTQWGEGEERQRETEKTYLSDEFPDEVAAAHTPAGIFLLAESQNGWDCIFAARN